MEWRGSGLPSFCANAMPVEFMSLASNLFDFNEVVEMITFLKVLLIISSLVRYLNIV